MLSTISYKSSGWHILDMQALKGEDTSIWDEKVMSLWKMVYNDQFHAQFAL